MTAKPDFEGVARTIAKADPPLWLPIALEHFSPGIGEEPANLDYLIKQMTDAVDLLLRYLPAFENFGYGLAGEREDIRVVLALLPGIKHDLERGLHKGTGRRPDAGKIVCAAVMIEAWKLTTRGSVEPHSLEFREACGEYWKACGGPESGDPENWRRPITAALEMKRDWIRKIIAGIQNACIVQNAR